MTVADSGPVKGSTGLRADNLLDLLLHSFGQDAQPDAGRVDVADCV